MAEVHWTNLYIKCDQWSDGTGDDDHKLKTNGIRIFCMKSLDVDDYPPMYDFDINGIPYPMDCTSYYPRVLSIEFYQHSLTQYQMNTLRYAFENQYQLTIYDRDTTGTVYSPADTFSVDTFPFYMQYSARILQMPQGNLSPHKMVANSTWGMKFVIDTSSSNTVKMDSSDCKEWIKEEV